MGWHEFFRSKLVVLSIKGWEVFYSCCSISQIKLVLILLYMNGVECFNPNFLFDQAKVELIFFFEIIPGIAKTK
jgi:hypothetical protein